MKSAAYFGSLRFHTIGPPVAFRITRTLVSVSILVAVTGLVAATLIARAAQIWWKLRGARVIACPENRRPAGVRVNALRAATKPFARTPAWHLSSCSRWPERAGCGQECLGRIADAPEDCLVRNILQKWYEGKRCATCGRPFGAISSAGAKPAILSAGKTSMEWSEIPAERLPETLASAAPVCFTCHMSNSLLRNHPELVVDRHRAADLGVENRETGR